MLILIYYTATTAQGAIEGNKTMLVNDLTTSDDIEVLRDEITESLKKAGVKLAGSGKVVIANIMNIYKLGS